LIATTTLGGKAGRTPAALPFFETLQALLEEALSPFADDLSGRVEPGCDLIIAPPFRGVEYDSSPDDVSIR
jgi:hypothetical protein